MGSLLERLERLDALATELCVATGELHGLSRPLEPPDGPMVVEGHHGDEPIRPGSVLTRLGPA